ncbi:TPA: signal peptide peptidase SppA [Pasteurella multocida]|uniref:Signal peptide peptidase SppA n=2 Tax=Pasteurella multocida TaxID=747 RepID=A0A849CGD0_PASMD|nr:signal peptide peptidase SppA [Pasteurella multocida]AWW59607.1 signal peptide peptidase SppA [Pasteurellaceae bacterium 12591]AET15652.1 protease 4 [Pasteurella multocida 36950]AFI45740.1 signal peptide peptidase SppA, 67K type [Pasteurella multocida subsp. multocida str. 3480]AHE64138.1 protease 4 [Pasteurella multocida subsp. multocida str. HB03]AIN48204.1 signal peptide peptidase SppA, 67K type [Pasteurella multocida]
MQLIVQFFRLCWRILNFIRELVMNIVFLFFVLLVAAVVGIFFHSNKIQHPMMLENEKYALLLNLDGYLADNREESMSWQKALKELDNQHVPRQISTFDIVYMIDHAKKDDRISGLVLDLNFFEGADLPALEYVGQTINAFKESQKPVIAFADNLGQSQYLLASYADEIYINPIGQVDITGLRQENLYFKSMLENLDVTAHIFRVGTYKSAVEPFLRDNMSPEAKTDLSEWLGAMWHNYKQIVAKNRQIDPDDVLPASSKYIQALKMLKGDSTAYTQQRQLVTGLANRLEIDEKLLERFGQDKNDNIRLIDYEDYLSLLPDRLSEEGQYKIAVVNVEGAIIDGESDEHEVGGDTIARLLRQAHDDDNVKAVILRVNSPGGSAFASEIIRQEVDNLQALGKPVVVSMGAMAASGGYWISSTADYIIADKNTITGSIGIFALFPTFEKTLKKVGISADGVSTSALSSSSRFSGLSSEMSDILQLEIESGYDKFLSVVSRGRGMTVEEVDKIAQGKIWLGEEAVKHNLVDELGHFNLAVEKASELANQLLDEKEKVDYFALQWMVEDEQNFLSDLLPTLKRKIQAWVGNTLLESIALPVEYREVRKQIGLLNKMNDPKGKYLYCLTCSTIN